MKAASAALTGFALLSVARFVSPAAPPVEADEYTRYELLSSGSSQFHILYEVTATSPGATYFFNPIRKGSEATGERVFDRRTGRPLVFDVVSGEEARGTGLADAESDVSYIRVKLLRAVPEDGGARLLIEKTYKDPKSYFLEGDLLVFSRSLGIPRDAVVLPSGYEVVSCNVPAQILREADGRLRVSFMSTFPGPVNVIVKGRRLAR